MKETDDAILITLSRDTIKDRPGGFKAIAREWLECDGLNCAWYYKTGAAPKHLDRIVWVYWVIAGRIRWRCRLLDVAADARVRFAHGVFYARAWLVLFDFEPVPRTEQTYVKGFQGFRYIQGPQYRQPVQELR